MKIQDHRCFFEKEALFPSSKSFPIVLEKKIEANEKEF